MERGEALVSKQGAGTAIDADARSDSGHTRTSMFYDEGARVTSSFAQHRYERAAAVLANSNGLRESWASVGLFIAEVRSGDAGQRSETRAGAEEGGTRGYRGHVHPR